MRARRIGIVAGAVVVAAVVAMVVLVRPGDPYPLPEGPGASQSGPVALGSPTQAVVVFMEPRPGDRIELLGADAIGLPPAVQPTLYLSRPVLQANGDLTIGEEREPIAGAVIEKPAGASPGYEHTFGIVAEMTPAAAGTYELTGIRLRFRINGGFEQVREGISVIWTVCADDPAPTTCQPPGSTAEPES